jgi:16S rRNA (guanine966-N2)-methyltransferase
VTLVESDPRACRLIAVNLAGCGVTDGYTIVRSPVDRALADLVATFDIVFLDPPYGDPSFERWIAEAASRVGPDGVLVVEHARKRPSPARAGGLERVRELPSGDSALSFYRRRASAVASAPEDVP